MISKKVNKSGGVTIPQQLRHAFGIGVGTAIDITVNGEDMIITKHAPTCHFCGSQEQVIAINKKEICNKCADEIIRKVKSNASN